MSDLAGRNSKLSFNSDGGQNPVWSPDGTRIVYSSASGRGTNIYLKAANGGGKEEILLTGPSFSNPMDWSSDGKYLLLGGASSLGSNGLWLLRDPGGPPPAGGRKREPFVEGPFVASSAQFSPDSRWVAFTSNESGRHEVHVRSSPSVGGEGKWLVSSGGGYLPRWRRDGKELFYLSLDGKLMAVDIITQPVFQAKPAKNLFNTAMPFSIFLARFDVSADGSKFLSASRSESPSPITVVLNWSGLLKK